jgi:histidyl-tRNA synthetase
MKKADKSGAGYALVLGENEIAAGTVALKPLRSGEEQREISVAELAPVLRGLLA